MNGMSMCFFVVKGHFAKSQIQNLNNILKIVHYLLKIVKRKDNLHEMTNQTIMERICITLDDKNQ